MISFITESMDATLAWVLSCSFKKLERAEPGRPKARFILDVFVTCIVLMDPVESCWFAYSTCQRNCCHELSQMCFIFYVHLFFNLDFLYCVMHRVIMLVLAFDLSTKTLSSIVSDMFLHVYYDLCLQIFANVCSDMVSTSPGAKSCFKNTYDVKQKQKSH